MVHNTQSSAGGNIMGNINCQSLLTRLHTSALVWVDQPTWLLDRYRFA